MVVFAENRQLFLSLFPSAHFGFWNTFTYRVVYSDMGECDFIPNIRLQHLTVHLHISAMEVAARPRDRRCL